MAFVELCTAVLRYIYPGDEIVCVVKRARPISAATLASSTALKVRRGDVRRAVIVRTKKAGRRPDGHQRKTVHGGYSAVA